MGEVEKIYKNYKRKGLSEMSAWKQGDDMTGISISEPDATAGSPKEGDQIARNPNNHDDKWLVAKKYFEDNLEEARSTETYLDRLKIERDDLADKLVKLKTALKIGAVPPSAVPTLELQASVMAKYLHVLNTRLPKTQD